MADRYATIVNSLVGAVIADRVGLPRPPVLRRHSVGAPLLPGPALVGATGGPVPDSLRELLQGIGADVAVAPAGDAGDDTTRFGALVLDVRRLAAPAELAEVRDFLAGRLRGLLRNGRVVLLARRPAGESPSVDATRQAVEGIVRSLAKELRGGSTANLLWVEDEASLASALRFLLSGRSAYVDGQPLLLGPGDATGAADEQRPLAGKTALVTGAARGIGEAIATVLARDGARVIAADLPAAGEALVKVANRIGGTTLHLDVAAADAPRKLLAHLGSLTDGLDVLVHNAGITRDKLLANMRAEQWDSVIAVNLQSQLALNDALLASDALNDRARVVCLSSTTGFAGNRGQTNYGATKAGVIGLVRSYAPAFAAHGGATINGVAPGFIDTEMTAHMPLATREVARRLSSLQQAGLPIDVAEAVAWLSSPGAGGVNGQVLRVCGQNLVGA
jgi:3-oxoacyl-[acyl-carrier protein] reductase